MEKAKIERINYLAPESKVRELTDEERQIILKGCLINYNRV